MAWLHDRPRSFSPKWSCPLRDLARKRGIPCWTSIATQSNSRVQLPTAALGLDVLSSKCGARPAATLEIYRSDRVMHSAFVRRARDGCSRGFYHAGEKHPAHCRPQACPQQNAQDGQNNHRSLDEEEGPWIALATVRSFR